MALWPLFGAYHPATTLHMLYTEYRVLNRDMHLLGPLICTRIHLHHPLYPFHQPNTQGWTRSQSEHRTTSRVAGWRTVNAADGRNGTGSNGEISKGIIHFNFTRIPADTHTTMSHDAPGANSSSTAWENETLDLISNNWLETSCLNRFFKFTPF